MIVPEWLRKLGKKRLRVEGSLLGVAVGDALGLPFEHLAPYDIPVVRDERLEYIDRFHASDMGPAGRWSDDTGLTLATASAFLQLSRDRATFDAALFYRFFSGATMPRPGRTVPRAISRRRPDPTSWSNGALIRMAPVGLVGGFGLDEARTAELAWQTARLTHTNPLAVYPAVECALAVRSALLQDEFVPDYAQVLLGMVGEDDELRSEVEGYLVERGKPTDAHHPSCALWQWKFVHDEVLGFMAGRRWEGVPDFLTGVTVAVNNGWDKDSVGAVAGGILGAYWDLPLLPSELLDKVYKSPQIRRVAEDLAHTADDYDLEFKNRLHDERKEELEEKQGMVLESPKPAKRELVDEVALYVGNRDLPATFCNLVVRNEALNRVCEGGVSAFCRRHLMCFNDHIAVMGAMGFYFDDVIIELHTLDLESPRDFFVHESSGLENQGNTDPDTRRYSDTGVDWCRFYWLGSRRFLSTPR